MIKIDRSEIEKVKTAVQSAMDTARTVSGLKIGETAIPDKDLEKCAMIALQAATMESFGVHDVAVASDVTHISDGKAIS